MGSRMIYTFDRVVQHTWGYGQTNQDFYLIIKRTPKTVILRQLKSADTMTPGAFMMGTCVPLVNEFREDKVEFRMRVFGDGGQEELHPEFGWMKIWDGEPANWTAYY